MIDRTVPPVDQEPDHDTELGVFVVAVWRQKWPVLAATVLCGILALGIGLATPPSYESTAKLIVTPAKTAATGDVAPTVSVETYRALVQSQAVAAKVLAEFGLTKEPYFLTPDDFIERVLRVENLRDTSILAIRIRLRDPALSARVANRHVELVLSQSQRLSQDEIVRARDAIGEQLAHSKRRLEEAQQRRDEYRQKAQLELLKKDVESRLEQRENLLTLLVEIQTEKARLAAAENMLAKRSKVDTVTRTIDEDGTMSQAVRELGGTQRSLLGLRMNTETPSKVYEELEQMVAETRTRLSGLERQKAELVDVRQLGADQLEQLNRLYEREAEFERLTLEYDLAKRVYESVSTRYEEARLLVVNRSAQLQLMDPAVPPSRKAAPRVLRNTVLGALAGFALAVFVVLFTETDRRAARRERRFV